MDLTHQVAVLVALGTLLAACSCDDGRHSRKTTVEEDSEPDLDGDGWPVPGDCDDSDPSVHPGAVDAVLDEIDSDCDGSIQEEWSQVGLRDDESFGSAMAWSARGTLLVGAPHGENGRIYEISRDDLDVLLNGTDGDLLGAAIAVSDSGAAYLGAPWRGEHDGVLLDDSGAIRASAKGGARLGGRIAARGAYWAATTRDGVVTRDGAFPSSGRPGAVAILADGTPLTGLPWQDRCLESPGWSLSRAGGPSGSSEAGAALAVGDILSGDVESIVMGDPVASIVWLFPSDPPPSSLDDAIAITGHSGRFGQSLALGELTGDAHVDLVIGAPLAGLDAEGAIFVFAGPITRAMSQEEATWSSTGEPGDMLGASIAVSQGSLAAGAPGRGDRAGRVLIWNE